MQKEDFNAFAFLLWVVIAYWLPLWGLLWIVLR